MKRFGLAVLATLVLSLGGGLGMLKYYESLYYRNHGWTK